MTSLNRKGIPVLMLNGAKMEPHESPGKGNRPGTTYQHVKGAAEGNRVIVVKDDGTEHYADLFIGNTLDKAQARDGATGESRDVTVRGRILALRFTADPPSKALPPLTASLRAMLDSVKDSEVKGKLIADLRGSYTF